MGGSLIDSLGRPVPGSVTTDWANCPRLSALPGAGGEAHGMDIEERIAPVAGGDLNPVQAVDAQGVDAGVEARNVDLGSG